MFIYFYFGYTPQLLALADKTPTKKQIGMNPEAQSSISMTLITIMVGRSLWGLDRSIMHSGSPLSSPFFTDDIGRTQQFISTRYILRLF